MNPPKVYDVTTPSSHRTSNITKMVQSICLSPLPRTRAIRLPNDNGVKCAQNQCKVIALR
jgi:hypothetical protein